MIKERVLWLIVGPSGTGKSTIVNWLKQHLPEIVSYTTRDPRPGEVPGETYHYISREEFAEREAAGEFIEVTEYSGNRYGSSGKDVRTALETKDVLIIVDGHGAEQFRGQDFLTRTIYLMPPFLEGGKIDKFELRRRMEERGDSEDKIQSRLKTMEQELVHAVAADYHLPDCDKTLAKTIAASIIVGHQEMRYATQR